MLTNELVEEFNATLKRLNCSFRLQYDNESGINGEFRIIPSNKLFINVAEIQLTDEFNRILENFFKEKGITLQHNNDRSIYWAKKDNRISLGKVS